MGRIFTRRIWIFVAIVVGFFLLGFAGFFIDEVFGLIACIWVVVLSEWLSWMRCPKCNSLLHHGWFPYFRSACPKCDYKL